MAIILDGKTIAKKLEAELAAYSRIREIRLDVILVGDNLASATYVRNKHRAAERVGIQSVIHTLPVHTKSAEIEQLIDELNSNEEVDGILLQLPLPEQLNSEKLLDSIHPMKDVDVFHPENAGLAYLGRPRIWPCTPSGILRLLHEYEIDIVGKHAVVVGRSNIVGKPMAALLQHANATVTVCHRMTKRLQDFTRQADILVVAAGSPGLIGKDDIKPGAVVIDVGSEFVNGKLTGDVRFAEVEPIASAITPVPGGVGPLTIASLLSNTVRLASLRRGWAN